MDTLSLEHLPVWTRIGVPAAERASEQRLLISIRMETDARHAGTSDALKDTIDYDTIVAAVRELAMQERQTIERFAQDIAQEVLKRGPKRVTVQIVKTPAAWVGQAVLSITRP